MIKWTTAKEKKVTDYILFGLAGLLLVFLIIGTLWETWSRRQKKQISRGLVALLLAFIAIQVHLNRKYHPWGLINDMQMHIYNRKHWHALSRSLHFVRHKGRLATHPPSLASKSGSRLPIFNSVCLGLVPGQIDSPYLITMS